MLSAAACMHAVRQTFSPLLSLRIGRSGDLASLCSADADGWLLSVAACVHAACQLANPMPSLRIRRRGSGISVQR